MIKKLPTPKDEPEVPVKIRNPFGSSFLQRVLLQYQVVPTGHPYNPTEQLIGPDTFQEMQQNQMMTKDEKIKAIMKRDARWRRF